MNCKIPHKKEQKPTGQARKVSKMSNPTVHTPTDRKQPLTLHGMLLAATV